MTRAQAIASALEVLATAAVPMLGLDGTSVDDAARAAYTPTGPSLDELRSRIAERRRILTIAA